MLSLKQHQFLVLFPVASYSLIAPEIRYLYFLYISWLSSHRRQTQLHSQAILIRIIHGVMRPQAALAQKSPHLIVTVSCRPDTVNHAGQSIVGILSPLASAL
jgi:hypothetical protein